MDEILRPFIDKCVIVYLDDILIFSRSWEEHVKQRWQVFNTLQQHRLYLNMEKCSFANQHQIFGVCNWLCKHSCWPRKSTDPQRLIHSSKHSWTKKFSWFGKFLLTIHIDFSHIAWNLNQLTKGNRKVFFKSTPTQQQVFEQLKHNLYTAPVLVLPNLH